MKSKSLGWIILLIIAIIIANILHKKEQNAKKMREQELKINEYYKNSK